MSHAFDDGLYVVQAWEGSEPEVARFAGDVFILTGMEAGFRPHEMFRIGSRLEIDMVTLLARADVAPADSGVTMGLSSAEEALIEQCCRREAVESFHDDSCPERICERDECGRVYRGPGVYCSMPCALADAA